MSKDGADGASNERAERKPDRIESHLKRAFSETLEEPLPGNLADLVAKLRKTQGESAQ